MRTLQEKYNAVLEGNYSKAQFVRDARMFQPQFITQYNGYDDAVQILKNKGMIAEAKAQEPKYSTTKPEDTIAPDVLDTGIKFELDKKYGTLDVTDEQYAKCREMAIKNLANDVLYYVKQDSIQLETPGEKMEKAKLNEGFLDRFKKKPNTAPGKGTKVLSPEEIDAEMAKTGIEDMLANASSEVYSLENATEKQVLQFLPVVAKINNSDREREYMIANALRPIKAYQKFADKFEKGVAKNTFNPSLVNPVVKAEPNQTLKEISKEEAWKEFQEKRHVTDKTVEAAKKDFEKGWEEGKFRDGNYMTEETGPTGIALSQEQMDQLHDKGAVMVQVTVKDSDGKIRTVDYPLSYLGYEKGIDDTEDSELEEGHGENPKKFKESDSFDPAKFYIKDLKSGRILNAISTQGSKIVFHYDTEADAQAQADWITRWEGDPGRFEVLPGTDPEVEALVNKQTGVGLDELFGLGGGKAADAELITKLTTANFRDVPPVTDIKALGLRPNEFAIADMDNKNFVVYLKGLNPQGGAIPNKFRDQKTAQAILNSLLKTNNALGMNKLSKNLQVVSGGGAVNEQQLKELFKKIITKIITE